MSQGLTKYDSDGADMSPQDGTKNILTQIAAAVNRLAGVLGFTPAQGIPVTPPKVTSKPQNLGASSSLTIPAGAKGWTVTCLTGTLSIACGTTASALPAGFSDSDPNIVGADIIITTDLASTAYVRWNT